MEKYSDYFRVLAEVDLSAIRRNLVKVKEKISPYASPVAIVKADAYGHGACKVASAICDLVSAFAVATIDEGIDLRKNGIENPIYVLGFTHPALFEEILNYSLIPTVFRKEDALLLSEYAKKANKTAEINIKVDTGMGRIGFLPTSESVKTVIEISHLENISLYGIFTHFSTSDEKEKSFTLLQNDIFESFVETLEDSGVRFKTVHALNSAACLEMPGIITKSSRHKTEARIGIALYGLYPSFDVSKELLLEPAMTLKSHIVYIKEVASGTPIGYGRSFTTIRPSRIATIPVGYADGYSRRLSSYGRVIINGQLAPIVGKICMDMCMVDVTDIPSAREYDEVILMGSDGKSKVSADDIASLTGTINYDIVCAIGKRVPRVYKE